MDVLVCIKQVPETWNIGWDPEIGTLLREDADGVLNPVDKNALEAGVQIKEDYGGTVTAISMGPPQAGEVLREALSMGADRAILMSDPSFAGADTLATSYVLGLAVKNAGKFDLILCGKESSDGMTGHLGPQLAEMLGLPQLTCAMEIKLDTKSVRIKQKWETGFRVLEAPLPALITVEKEINRPRVPPMDRIMQAYREKEVCLWKAGSLKGDAGRFGLGGSPTKTKDVYKKKIQRGKVEFLKGNPEEAAEGLVRILRQKGLV